MTLTTQLYTMLSMVGMGIWLGMSLDTYNRFSRYKKRLHWLRFINDLIFWIVQGLILFFILLEVNEGEVRFYIFIALLCGYAAYKGLFESYYKRALEIIIRIAVSTYRFLVRLVNVLLIHPSKVILQLLFSLGKMIVNMLLSILLFMFGVLIFPLKSIGRLIWRSIPKEKWNKFKNKAGFFLRMKNRVKNWFRR
jgi:spore cortex biosynthesis protein YabQ